jgi:hypothetical protein
MTEILALLQSVSAVVPRATLRQLSRIIEAMLSMTGRITMLGLSRWTEKGGSYRTIQRFYHSSLNWAEVQWLFFTGKLWKAGHEYLLVGDEVVVDKAGKETFGLGRFFSSIHQRSVSAISFFAFSLIDVQECQSYPLQVSQIVKEPQKEKKPRPSKSKPAQLKRRPGRPKGSKNKTGQAVVLNVELQLIQGMVQTFMARKISYLVLDGHFGNYLTAWMARQADLHLISKLRSDARLLEPFTGKYRGPGRPTKYGERIDVGKMKKKYLKQTTIADHIRTDTYQALLLSPEFHFPLNVVILLKTNLDTLAQAHVILFSTDLKLEYQKMIDFYSLRFQIEFNFRDAKQYWGLDDFMNVEQNAVTNAANLSFFMVNLSSVLLQPWRQTNSVYSVLDLKAHYHGRRYAIETIKLLPHAPDRIFISSLFEKIGQLGMIHPVFQPISTS